MDIPKVIYMTYKKIPQIKVFERWRRLNPTYKIDFSLDKHCILFIKDNFSVELAKLFIDIPIGMYKADLWRLCKLYIHGGVYADIDLVPYVSIDSLLNGNSFYSCIGIDNKSIFQALIITTPKNPLILCMLMSLIQNRPFYKDGPTTDMYNCLKFNINKKSLNNLLILIRGITILLNISIDELFR